MIIITEEMIQTKIICKSIIKFIEIYFSLRYETTSLTLVKPGYISCLNMRSQWLQPCITSSLCLAVWYLQDMDKHNNTNV